MKSIYCIFDDILCELDVVVLNENENKITFEILRDRKQITLSENDIEYWDSSLLVVSRKTAERHNLI
jgi:hypothetical protein